jgi:hypothetical protein
MSFDVYLTARAASMVLEVHSLASMLELQMPRVLLFPMAVAILY